MKTPPQGEHVTFQNDKGRRILIQFWKDGEKLHALSRTLQNDKRLYRYDPKGMALLDYWRGQPTASFIITRADYDLIEAGVEPTEQSPESPLESPADVIQTIVEETPVRPTKTAPVAPKAEPVVETAAPDVPMTRETAIIKLTDMLLAEQQLVRDLQAKLSAKDAEIAQLQKDRDYEIGVRDEQIRELETKLKTTAEPEFTPEEVDRLSLFGLGPKA